MNIFRFSHYRKLQFLVAVSVALFSINLFSLTSILMLMVFVFGIINIILTQKILVPNSWLLRAGLFVFGVAIVLSLTANGRGERTINFLLSINLKLTFLLIVFMSLNYMCDIKALIKTFNWGVMLGVITVLYELVDFFLQGGGLISLAGIYGNRNSMVGLVMPACLFSLIYLGDGKKGNNLVSYFFLVSYFVLLLSQGRAALGLTTIGIILISIYSAKIELVRERIKWWLIMLTILIIGIIAYDNVFISFLIARYFEFGGDDYAASYSDEMRKALLKTGMDLFQNNFLFGIGPEEFKRYGSAGVYQELGSDVLEGTVSDQINMHNTYLSVLTELGVTGGVGFLLIVFSGMQSCYVAFKFCSNKTERHWIFGLGCTYTLYSMYMLTGHFLYDYPFWFLLALMMALPKAIKNEGQKKRFAESECDSF